MRTVSLEARDSFDEGQRVSCGQSVTSGQSVYSVQSEALRKINSRNFGHSYGRIERHSDGLNSRTSETSRGDVKSASGQVNNNDSNFHSHRVKRLQMH